MQESELLSDTVIDGKRFHCDRCGECCKHVNYVPQLKDFDTGNGRCRYLTDDNLCSIYKDRPNVCRGTYMYYKYFSYMSAEEYYAMTTALCNKLKAHEKLY